MPELIKPYSHYRQNVSNDLRRQQLVLALHFRSPWFSGHAFSLNVGGTATPAAISALWAWPST
jgi:hypothetical protein